jgi:hypothetical protein
VNGVLAFVLGIPLAAELLGACLSVFDSWRQPDARAAAVERVAIPMLLWGALWWLVGADAGVPLWSALLTVGLWQVVSFYAIRLLSRWRRFQTIAIDTDIAGDTTGEKRAPATMGIGEGRGSRRGVNR